MKLLSYISKYIYIAIFACIMPFVLGASTISGSSGESKKSSKYSLHNLSNYSKKSINFSLLKTPSLYSGSTILNQQTNINGGIQLNTAMQFHRGNVTYIIPYKLKLKTTKFKLPAPTPVH